MAPERKIFGVDHQLFRQSFRTFVEREVKPQQKEWEAKGIVPREVWKRCGELGFLVPAADEAYGGLGVRDFCFDAIIIEELARINETGLLLSLHNSVVAPYLLSYGSEELKARIMPGAVSGEIILALAMTEPEAGSDLAAMKTTAVDKGDHWLLNGSKCFISNGINSDAVIVAAKTNPEDPHGMGLFLVERGDSGFERGPMEKKIGMWAQDTAPLYFNNVEIKKENVLGDPNMGFIYMMEKLPCERLTVCIGAVASCQAAIAVTVEYVKGRKVFGRPISRFQNTQFKLAELKTETDIAEVYVDRLIEAHNEGKLSAEDACGGKYWTTELACRVMDECLQLHGGYGYMMEYPISRMYLNARVGRIYAGTNEIMKTVVARAMDL